MRLLILHHTPDQTPRIRDAARGAGATNVATFRLDGGDGGDGGDGRVTVLTVENPAVEDVVSVLDDVEAGVVLLHSEVMSVPAGAAADESVQTARARSPAEIYLAALSAIGGWGTFLGYAAVAGLLAWAGLFNGTVFLLIAAMLVAPFPNPVLNAAIATARGHGRLLVRSVARYTVALAVGVAVAWAFSALFDVDHAGDLARSVATLSSTAILLPLVAGIVGGLYLTQSEDSSLVSAAGAGLLVTAALSPPAAVLGIALWTGEGPLAIRAVYLLLLQIVAINLTAAATFRLRGLGIRGPWYSQGRRGVAVAAAAVSLAVLIGLLSWQRLSPDMRRGTVARDALALVRSEVASAPGTRWLDGAAEIRDDGSDRLLLATARAAWDGPPAGREVARARIVAGIRRVLEGEGFPRAVVDLSLLEWDRGARRPEAGPGR